MSKILGSVFVFLFFHGTLYGGSEIKVISRAEWGANESYRYLESPEWKTILKEWNTKPKQRLNENQKKQALVRAEKTKIANDFLVSHFRSLFAISSVSKFENGNKLAWPIAKSENKKSIVIHHTADDYSNSFEGIREVYKSHALYRKWGDIGYNYLIGMNGEIFEGRAGGDYVVGAHDKWNNQSSIGIALLGNYHKKKISDIQYQSLENLVRYLGEKYRIDFNTKVPFFKWCVGSAKCDKEPLDLDYDYPIIGHRDAGHTDCPGDELYKQIQQLRKTFIQFPNEGVNKVHDIIRGVSQNKLVSVLAGLEQKIDQTQGMPRAGKLLSLKNIILDIAKDRSQKVVPDVPKMGDSFDDNNKIKVKLSYPKNESIDIKVRGSYIPKIYKKKQEYVLYFEDCNRAYCEDRNYHLNFAFSGSQLFLNKREVIGFGLGKIFRIKSPRNLFLTISSWDRIESEETNTGYNDNKFKGDIVFYQKSIEGLQGSKLTVVNDVVLTDYLKGLGDLDDSTHIEKIKVIIILARTYARWYMAQAEKFIGEWYHTSDYVNAFQRYRGFGPVERYRNLSSAIEETKDLIITYNGELIKPWYFSDSDGTKEDFIEFCNTAEGVPDCAHPERFPFLIGVQDEGVGDTNLGYEQQINSKIEYFANRGWIASMIIKYFLKGTSIKRM